MTSENNKPKYEVIKSGTLSKIGDTRYICVSPETGEILDDAQGYGYKTIQKAHAAFAYKFRDKSKDAEKQELEGKIELWCNEHKNIVKNFDTVSFEIAKGSWGPDDVFDVKMMKEMLIDSGFKIEELPFKVKDLYRYYTKGPFTDKKHKRKRK